MKYLVLALSAAALLHPVPVRAQAKSIDVYASVLDQKGQPVDGLTAADFAVKEDGNSREVLKVAPATAPLTVALLVDDSQVAGRDILSLREGAQKFIDALAGKAEIALVTYGERPTVVQEYTTDTAKLDAAARGIFPRSGAGGYLLDAIVEVSHGLQKREAARPVIAVLMLERDVEFSNREYSQVLKQVELAHATLEVVAVGPPNDSTGDEIRNRNTVIGKGTDETGGRRDQVLAMVAAPARMEQMAQELGHQYVVTYAQPERLIPAEKLQMTVNRPGLTVRARKKPGHAR